MQKGTSGIDIIMVVAAQNSEDKKVHHQTGKSNKKHWRAQNRLRLY